uniref:Uncharacterized protein n=1 Tax=Myotis myotis TaxID=51298 RepID=A0A7J7Z4S8_MYOMY|nr:hypothetical protein mMyoMyo1_010603 [Myotis myotis]
MEHTEPSLRTRMLGDWDLLPGTAVASLGPWQHWESRPRKQTSLGSAAREPSLSCEAFHPSGLSKGQLALLLLGKQQFPLSASSCPCPASRLRLGPPHPRPQSLAPETLDKPPALAEAPLEMLWGPYSPKAEGTGVLIAPDTAPTWPHSINSLGLTLGDPSPFLNFIHLAPAPESGVEMK